MLVWLQIKIKPFYINKSDLFFQMYDATEFVHVEGKFRPLSHHDRLVEMWLDGWIDVWKLSFWRGTQMFASTQYVKTKFNIDAQINMVLNSPISLWNTEKLLFYTFVIILCVSLQNFFPIGKKQLRILTTYKCEKHWVLELLLSGTLIQYNAF